MNQRTVEFWFDFGSPYAYIAHCRLPAFEKQSGAKMDWRPFMLGTAFSQTGARPLLDIPLKANYAALDLARLAKHYDVPFRLPPNAPTVTLTVSRIFYALKSDQPEVADQFGHTVFNTAFGEGRDVSDPSVIKDCIEKSGLTSEILDLAQVPQWKQALKDAGETAIEKGVFGAPFFICDAEPFWGVDRMDMLASKLKSNHTP